MVYCCFKGLYFIPLEDPNSLRLHSHTNTNYTHSRCWNRTWEAFPLAAHHHENLLTWQKAVWWMTGLSRRLYTGALNYVLHSQIIVTESFTGTMLTDSHSAGHITRYTSCRSICATIKISGTAITKTGGVQNQTRTNDSSTGGKKSFRRSFKCRFLVSCFHMFTIIFMGVRMASVLSSQCGILLSDVPVESFPPLDTSRRADKLWFASKLIVIPRFHREVSCITITPRCSCVSCWGPNPLFWQYFSPAALQHCCWLGQQ